MSMCVVMFVILYMRMCMFVRMRMFGMMRFMEMHIIAFLLFAVNRDGKPGAGDAAAHCRFPPELHAFQSKRIHPRRKCIRIGQQFGKGSGQHIARRAHSAFNVQQFHDFLRCD